MNLNIPNDDIEDIHQADINLVNYIMDNKDLLNPMQMSVLLMAKAMSLCFAHTDSLKEAKEDIFRCFEDAFTINRISGNFNDHH